MLWVSVLSLQGITPGRELDVAMFHSELMGNSARLLQNEDTCQQLSVLPQDLTEATHPLSPKVSGWAGAQISVLPLSLPP